MNDHSPTLEECQSAADLLRREATAIDGQQPIRRFWISVKDALPGIGVSVLAHGDQELVSWESRVLYRTLKRQWGFDFSVKPGQPLTADVPERECVDMEYHTLLIAAESVTHWMPLPEAPE